MTLFKPGDCVQLKSGGPLMAVRCIFEPFMASDYGVAPGVHCEWFTGDCLRKVVILPVQLTLVPETPEEEEAPTTVEPEAHIEF
jgi:uncharacterized protein YodC (DUF2158 family)